MKQISLNNGNSFDFADELTDEQWTKVVKYWNAILELMDDDIRNAVNNEGFSNDEKQFLCRYLELAKDDLILG